MAPAIIQGRTMVPVRFVAENLGATVEWIEAERIVRITRDMPALPPIGGILNRGTNMEPDTLNPLFSNNNMSRWINTITNLGLIRLDEQGIPVNSLADRWTWDAQTLTFRFWLRQGVRWHDGRTFSAADVKFTFDTILDPAYTGVRKGDFADLASVTVIDAHTVDFRLSRINAPFLSRMVLGILPQHVFANVPIAQMNAQPFSRAPIGTGPFKLDRWVTGQTLSFTRHGAYHLDVPFLDGMLFRVYQDNDVMALAWETGEIDWHGSLPALNASRLMADFDTRAYFKEIPAPQYEFVRPNMGNRILADRRVRIALMHAIDRPAMVNSMLDGRAHVMLGHQLPTSWAFLRTGLEPYAFNRTRAIQLLTEAGFRTIGADGIRRNAAGDRMSFTLLTTAGNSLRADMAAYLQDMWKRIGIEIRIEVATFPVVIGALNRSTFDLVLLAPGLEADPDPFIYFHSSQGLVNNMMVGRNNGNWNFPEYDRLLEAGRATFDVAERRAIYHQLEQLINRDLPFLPMFNVQDVHGIHNRVQGIVWGITGPILPELVYIRR
ncbi:MAG: Oligopeptide-binding protein AppA [Firmicutes bacterium]|nr:Oligopeptide-binding protein AppA [candidate division NPL-UPA2 bacterium]